jgi:translation initiation factor IF-1
MQSSDGAGLAGQQKGAQAVMKPFARAVAQVLVPLGLFMAQDAHAGTAYIPLPGITTVGPITYKTQIDITNTARESLAVDSLQLAPGVDGTLREGRSATRLSIVPRKTFVYRPDPRSRGLLELEGAAGLRYSARLIGTDGRRVELPVITSSNLGAADDTLVVQGLDGSASKVTDVVLVNLGETAASCSASVLRADGTYAIEPVAISVPPLSHLVFANIFKGFPRGIVDARSEVSCSNAFYAYAQTADAATGQLTIAGPSAASDSPLAIDKAISSPSTSNCSVGSLVCAMPNEVHTSSKALPNRTLLMSPPAGNYNGLTGHVEVKITGWNPVNNRGAHGVLYIVINKNKSLLANVFLRGPYKNSVTVRHGVCAGSCTKAKVEQGIEVQMNAMYAFDYVYNVAARSITMRMTQNGRLVAEIKSKPNVSRIQIKPGDQIVIGLSNPSVSSFEEPASVGWNYSNLRVELFR